MSKAYSNKALPAGTILREWRLEDVLGVGGFGIVYRGRGIYFGELVAIKEYFPSSISERDAEDTVVPIGSDVEEVHALGLKKFVEEAKLLWNLSTPSRHPNIVSVRSLFEVHGTAYMVMDFEDGVSLSKYLKEGRRFNERSLWNIVRPIAEGLDRAHRVGVLHRDIKPPNILITEDSRPVLIDFGSARFEAAEATSTTVTFHTPPYAAVEQYVKTYPQGPWTDIYALGVVLYECVTGEKPPEVLERLHGSQGKPLAEGHWPGFGKRFLQAIDAAMTIHPTERPQTIREWLALFGKKDSDAALSPDEDEPTRFFAHEVATAGIVPVAPLAPGVDPKEPPETGVPSDPGEAEFKRAGEETGASKRKKKDGTPAVADEPAKSQDGETPSVAARAEPAASPEVKSPVLANNGAKEPSKPWSKIPRAGLLAGGGALALAAVAGGFIFLGKGESDGAAGNESASNWSWTDAAPVSDVGGLAPAEKALADEAGNAGAPATAVSALVAVAEQLEKQSADLQALRDDPAQAAAATARAEEMKRLATSANVEFSNALLRDADARTRRFSADVPSSSPGAGQVRSALASLRSSVEASATLTDPAQSLSAARDALAKSQAFAAAMATGYSQAARRPSNAPLPPPTRTVTGPLPSTTVTTAAPAAAEAESSSAATGVSSGKLAQFNGIVDSGRGLARQVIQMGSASTASATRKANAQLARSYDKSLATLKDSMRGVNNDREADRLIKQANQTKAYIVFLNKQSSQSQ